jgi:hypothetical protein
MSFEPRLTPGETLGEPDVQVTHDGQDVTTDLLVQASINEKAVQFQLMPAVDDTQPAGLYLVKAKVNTSQGRILVGKVDLTIR